MYPFFIFSICIFFEGEDKQDGLVIPCESDEMKRRSRSFLIEEANLLINHSIYLRLE